MQTFHIQFWNMKKENLTKLLELYTALANTEYRHVISEIIQSEFTEPSIDPNHSEVKWFPREWEYVTDIHCKVCKLNGKQAVGYVCPRYDCPSSVKVSL